MMPSSNQTPERCRGYGDRLRQAREAAGLSVADVSQRLKMPARVIEALESGDADRDEAQVFVRGRLRSYARLLGVDIDDLADAADAPIQPAPIVPMTYTPPLQRVADKVMGRMVYIVITALIGVPVWMATRGHIDGTMQSASLEIPATTGANPASRTGPSPEAQPARPRPLVASMASIPQRSAVQEPALSLRFTDDSWVEIFDTRGARIEQGMRRAGERRDFDEGTVGRVVIGNARTVEVRRNGHVQDLSAFRRADVARFTVSSDGSLVPTSE